MTKLTKALSPGRQLEIAIDLLAACNNDLSVSYTDTFFRSRVYLEDYAALTDEDKKNIFLMSYSLLSTDNRR